MNQIQNREKDGFIEITYTPYLSISINISISIYKYYITLFCNIISFLEGIFHIIIILINQTNLIEI